MTPALLLSEVITMANRPYFISFIVIRYAVATALNKHRVVGEDWYDGETPNLRTRRH